MSWWDLKDSLLGNTRTPEEGDSRLLDSSTSESEEGEIVTMAETIDNLSTTGSGERGALFNSIRGKMRANRGWVSRYIDNDLESCLSMLDNKGPSAGRQVERAHALIEKLEEKMETIEDLLDQMVDMVPSVQADAEKKKSEVHKQISRARQAALNKIATYEIGQGVVAGAGAGGAQDGDGAARPRPAKVDESLKPDKLTPEFTPAEFEAWKREVETYFEANRLTDQGVSQAERRSRLNHCLGTHFTRWLFREKDPNAAIFGQGGCLAALDDEFKRLYPMFARRKQFFSMTPDRGEDFKAFRMRLREVGDMCDLSNMREEDCYIIKYHTAVNDEGLKQQLIANTGRNLRALDAVIDGYFAAKAGDRMTSESGRVLKAGNQRGRSDNRNRSKSPGGRKQGPCFGCGIDNHIKRDCHHKNTKCAVCNGVGHLPKHSTCPQNKTAKRSGRSQTPGPGNRSAKVEQQEPTEYEAWPPMMPPVPQGAERANMLRMASDYPRSYAEAVDGGKTKIYVYRKPEDLPIIKSEIITEEEACEHDTFQDTGASANVISFNLFRKWGLQLLPGYTRPMYSVTGEKMSVEGRTSFLMRSRPGFAFQNVELVVTRDTSDEIIIGLKDIKRQGLLPPNWPHQIGTWSGEEADRCKVTKPESSSVYTRLRNKLFHEFRDVINDTLPTDKIVGEPLHIQFKKDVEVRPRKFTCARRIPIHQEKAAASYIADLIEKGIIEKVEDDDPCDFISPAFFVPKANGKVRLVTDYKYINQFLDRPVQPFMSSRQIADAIRPESRVFATMDMVQGYYQIALDEESSKLTTFLLPDGKYRYKRLPMGMSIAGDVWNIRTDHVITGVTGALKMIDDILSQASDVEEIEVRLRTVLNRCRELGVTVSQSKFHIGESVNFVGYKISADGIRSSDKNLESIRNFPIPTCVKDVRAFLGLANQLTHFSPDLTQNTVNIRLLLKRESAFVWGEAQQADFERAKKILLSNTVVKPFIMGLRTELVTDASKLHGLGFALLQFEEGNEKPRLITCGSCALTPAQSRYAVCELEALGIQYALEKCAFYLRGAPRFQITTDHRPLVGIWNTDLAQISNPRLLRIRMKTIPYDFEVVWRAGKKMLLADALSRYPTFAPEAGSKELDDAHVYICRSIATHTPCQSLLEAAGSEEYKKIVECVETNAWESITEAHPAWHLRKWSDSMSTLKGEQGNALILVGGERIFVPQSARKAVIDILHEGHPGAAKMIKKANQFYFWPGLNNECELKVKSCMECAKLAPSQKKHELSAESAHAPMSHIGVDLFSWQGKNYLVAICRFSGWPFVRCMRSTTTDSVCKALSAWFNNFGWPSHIRTDGGPQFRHIFSEFCATRNINHEVASAFNASANGLAEAGVKQTKYLLLKLGSMGERYERELCAWRNTPRADGYSPAMLMFNRHLKEERLPVAAPALALRSHGTQEAGFLARQDTREAQVSQQNKSRTKREILPIGSTVLVQDFNSKHWDQFATITEIRPDQLSYLVRLHQSGNIVLRGRDLLKPVSLEQAPRVSTITNLKSILLPSHSCRHPKKQVTWDCSLTRTATLRNIESTTTSMRSINTAGSSTSRGAQGRWPSSLSQPSPQYPSSSACGGGSNGTGSGLELNTPWHMPDISRSARRCGSSPFPTQKATRLSELGIGMSEMSAPLSGAPPGRWSTSLTPPATQHIGRDPIRRENLAKKTEPTGKEGVALRFPVQLPRELLPTPDQSSRPPGAWTHRSGTRPPPMSWAALSKSSGSWSPPPRSTGLPVQGNSRGRAVPCPTGGAAPSAGGTTWPGSSRRSTSVSNARPGGGLVSWPTGKSRRSACLPPRLARLPSTTSEPPKSATGTEGDWFQVLKLKNGYKAVHIGHCLNKCSHGRQE